MPPHLDPFRVNHIEIQINTNAPSDKNPKSGDFKKFVDGVADVVVKSTFT